jgi:hypothetical protein
MVRLEEGNRNADEEILPGMSKHSGAQTATIEGEQAEECAEDGD